VAILEIEGLRKRYGATEALAGVDLAIERGEICGLLGPNGAGKSTLTKIACGLVRPTAGTVEVDGHPPGSVGANAAIGYLGELFRFPDWLKADEVLALHQGLTGSEGGQTERTDLLSDVGLERESGRQVSEMSKGMQQRLGLAQALVGSPTLLLLDEPSSALDPNGRRAVRGLLAELKERGVGVLLSSHLLSEVELVCDSVAIIDGGRLVVEGTPEELTRTSGVEITTADGKQSFPETEHDQVPELVAKLVAEGEKIFAVSPTSSTLEDFYVETIPESSE
jgi:ABC-2 type transport system ATP-binding protein